MSVEESLKTAKIRLIQIDFFGYCNAKCWFCPVRYQEFPKETLVHMPLQMVESIFAAINAEKGKLISENHMPIFTANYSEVFLYKHFAEMMALARKHKIKLIISTNGTTLTPEKLAILADYPDVLATLAINIPAFDADTWSDYVSLPVEKFDTLVQRLGEISESLSYLGKNLRIMVNGIDDEDHLKQIAIARDMFPQYDILVSSVQSRSGQVEGVSHGPILSEVTGCSAFIDRIHESIHINSIGDISICSNDFKYEYVFGNINTSTISEVWGSEPHIEVIKKAFSNMCKVCKYAIGTP